jgi:hypothetical protein
MMVEVGALTRQRLDELQRLLEVGAAQAEKLDAASKEPALALLTAEQTFALRMRHVDRFDRIARAVRQIIVLEFELLGLFKAPDRDGPFKPRLIKPELDGILTRPERLEKESLVDRPDYRVGPIEDVVAGIRKTLGVEPPPNDPFAPRPDRKPRETQPDAPRQKTSTPGPATIKLPEKAEPSPAIKAALLAIKARAGNGFRMPPAKPGTAKANPARPPKRRRNRGPPK